MGKPKENANCPYCLSPIADNEEKIRCPVCGVAHHAECWRMNGKCSVYGCEGWQAWSSEISDKIAPKIRDEIDIDATGTETEKQVRTVSTGPLCIECGKPVKPGRMVCGSCRGIWRPRYLENCAGPSVLLLGGVIALVVFVLKGLS